VEGCNEHAAYLECALSIVHCKNNVEHINTLVGKIQCFNAQQMVYIFNTSFERLKGSEDVDI
jgi:hypothetical protein